MSSSEQNTSNNSSRPQALDDYDYDITWSTLDNLNINEQPPDDYGHGSENEDDDNFFDDVEAELSTQDNIDEDDAIYSDDVQNAFSNYENQFSQYWIQSDPTWNNLSTDEQNEMFDQMRECMRYMSQEYMAAQMPDPSDDAVQTSQLNPDAVEFRPSWFPASTSNDSEAILATSETPPEAEKPEDG